MAISLAKLVALITPNRRWAQFSLASMFVVVTVLCVWLSIVVNRAHRQRDAVAAIEALGGSVRYAEPDEAFPKTFLRRWLHRDYLDDVIWVSLDNTSVADADLALLPWLPELQGLQLNSTQVTDAGIERLRGMTRLERLGLIRARQVTDSGLAHLRGLTSLRRLLLNETQVTSAGLAHVHGLARLQELFLGGTAVGDSGLVHLKELKSLERLELGATQVTDVGVRHLYRMKSLVQIMPGNSVTPAGRLELQKHLPKCKIGW